jgi:hypothetical protein
MSEQQSSADSAHSTSVREASSPQATPELTATCQKLLPGGIVDDATYAEIEDALDRAEAPSIVGGRWLKLHERIAALTAERTAASAEPQSQAVSAPLASNASDPLETLEGNCWDLRCIDIPTGGGDADIGWNIVEHHMGPPKERIVGRGRSPREALQDATSTLSRPKCGG